MPQPTDPPRIASGANDGFASIAQSTVRYQRVRRMAGEADRRRRRADTNAEVPRFQVAAAQVRQPGPRAAIKRSRRLGGARWRSLVHQRLLPPARRTARSAAPSIRSAANLSQSSTLMVRPVTMGLPSASRPLISTRSSFSDRGSQSPAACFRVRSACRSRRRRRRYSRTRLARARPGHSRPCADSGR